MRSIGYIFFYIEEIIHYSFFLIRLLSCQLQSWAHTNLNARFIDVIKESIFTCFAGFTWVLESFIVELDSLITV